VTIEPCTLVSKTIPSQTAQIGQRVDWTITPFTWTHPNRNYLTACGPIKYEIEGAPFTYIRVDTTSRVISLYSSLISDQRGATQRKIVAFPEKFKSSCSVFSLFNVSLTGPCAETGYTADQKAIPVMPNLHKYILGEDDIVYFDFAFNYLPLSCNFHKVY